MIAQSEVDSAPQGSGFAVGDRVVGLTGMGGGMAEVANLSPDLTFGLLEGRIIWDADGFDDEDPEVLEAFGLE